MQNEINRLTVLISKLQNKLDEIEIYCKQCNLKADFTACDILSIINEIKGN